MQKLKTVKMPTALNNIDDEFWGVVCARVCYALAPLDRQKIEEIVKLVETISIKNEMEIANDLGPRNSSVGT